MSTNEEKLLEEFEKSAENIKYDLKRGHTQQYGFENTQNAWKLWQACASHYQERIAELEQDRDEWKDSTIAANRRFEIAEEEVEQLKAESIRSSEEITTLRRQLAEQQSQNYFDATRLRRLISFCGVSAPESDEELAGVVGVVIGSCLRALENPTASQLSAEREAVRKESAEELAKAKEEVLVLRGVLDIAWNAIDWHQVDSRGADTCDTNALSAIEHALTNTSESAAKYAEELRKEGREEVWKQIDAMPTVGYECLQQGDGRGHLTYFKPREEDGSEYELIVEQLIRRPTKQGGAS